MGLKNALSSYLADLKEGEKENIKSGVFLLFCLLSAGVGIVLLNGMVEIFDLPKSDWYTGYEWHLAIFFMLAIPGSLGEHYLILENRPSTLVKYGAAVSLLYISIISIGAFYSGNLTFVFFGLILWAGFKFLMTLIFILRNGKFRFTFRGLPQFLTYSVPLVVTILLGTGMEIIDGLIVKKFFDEEMFVLYRYGAREFPLNTLLIGSMVTASIPALTANLGTNIINVKQKVDGYMDWMYPITIVLILVSPYLYQFFYNENYLISSEIFNIYLLIIATRILVPQTILYAKKKNSVLMWVSIIEVVFNFVMSIVLLKIYGIIGVAIATLLACCLEKILFTSYLKYKEGISLGTYINVKKYLLYNILLIVVFIVSLSIV